MNGNSQKVNRNVAILETHGCQLQATDLPQLGTLSWGTHREGHAYGAYGRPQPTRNSWKRLLLAFVCWEPSLLSTPDIHVLSLRISGTRCCCWAAGKGSNFITGLLTCWGMWASSCQGKNSTTRPSVQEKRDALRERRGA